MACGNMSSEWQSQQSLHRQCHSRPKMCPPKLLSHVGRGLGVQLLSFTRGPLGSRRQQGGVATLPKATDRGRPRMEPHQSQRQIPQQDRNRSIQAPPRRIAPRTAPRIDASSHSDHGATRCAATSPASSSASRAVAKTAHCATIATFALSEPHDDGSATRVVHDKDFALMQSVSSRKFDAGSAQDIVGASAWPRT
eukprot:CAMPEP_0115689634 /NCGR_PEP_ID=MMETSP0272-20121206/61666_1 /TAXON_ID=71861 /ORGANISM="Scrippsiella trochoidea, Strain CCMP3099" /LENGTH=194 /DNA_ID=CAMNT_0003129437 /DNA_START=96 /DNA_END=680 /DNA_ORIENTATION=-